MATLAISVVAAWSGASVIWAQAGPPPVPEPIVVISLPNPIHEPGFSGLDVPQGTRFCIWSRGGDALRMDCVEVLYPGANLYAADSGSPQSGDLATTPIVQCFGSAVVGQKLPFCWSTFPAIDSRRQIPRTIVGGAAFLTEVARTGAAKSRGLSGRTALAPGTGMLFPQPRDAVPVFWMRGMLIALDFIWIGADCRVAEITANVPPPDAATGERDLPRYRPAAPVRYALEINAGEAETLGIEVGAEVQFVNLDLGDACAA